MTSELSPEVEIWLRRIQAKRKRGYALSEGDADTLLTTVLLLTCPAHSCQDNPSLPCPACGWLERGQA